MLIGGLVAAGGARPQVVAAVLVYRVLTWLRPIPAGIGAYLWRGAVGGDAGNRGANAGGR